MSTLKISKHLDVPTALDLVKEEVGKEAKRIKSQRITHNSKTLS